MSDPFVDAVRQRMESLAQSLVRAGVASGFEISDAGRLGLSVRRSVDGAAASVTMTGTTEAYLLNLGDLYTTARTAYDEDGKGEIIDDFLECVTAFVERDYYEEVRERNGRVVSRVICLNVPGGLHAISAGGGWRAGMARLFGYTKSVVRPVEH